MSEVTRFGHIGTLVKAVPQILKLYPSMTVYVKADDFDRVTAEREGLQLALNTADQTIDDLQAAIARRNQRVEDLVAELAKVRQGPCKLIVGDELP